MRPPALLPLLLLCLTGLAAGPSPAADKSDAKIIVQLIKELGNDDFDARERASAELDAVGAPALESLRQASKSDDAEVCRRAETLAARIERRLESAKALAAKRIRLVYKDAPLAEAVDDFGKKSGYKIALEDADGGLKDRLVTLDTGDVTFWQALDEFCDKADLKEAERPDAAPAPVPGGLRGRGRQGWPRGGAAAVPPFGQPIAALDEITLADGAADPLPTDASSAVRIQALTRTDPSRPVADGEILIPLRLSLEPKLRWQSVDKATIQRAVDDQNQELAQATAETSPQSGGLNQDAVIRLKRGVKASKSLTQLCGTVSGQILDELAPVITANDILRAEGKEFKGGDGGLIKIADVSKAEGGQIVIRLELQPPADVVPAGGAVGRRIRRVPLRIQAAPGGAVAPGGAAVGIVVGPGIAGGQGINGIDLLDDKGGKMKLAGFDVQFQSTMAPNGLIVTTQLFVLTYQADQGQEASKLVYTGRKMLSVEVPFTLKDVPLP